ncbi:MAG: TAXI family TRAP transporter solute-binding subunit [Roseovarius sp.]|nr:TAXI family TRAP transporter solute-binding subunit [Roseovarius sp.]
MSIPSCTEKSYLEIKKNDRWKTIGAINQQMEIKMILKKLAVATTMSLTAMALVPTTAMSESEQTIFNIGTGGLGGIFWPTGGKVCDLMNRSRNDGAHNFRCVVESTGGSVSNLRGVRRNDLDLGLAQADLLFLASTGGGKFAEDGADEDLRFVMSFNQNMLHVMARAEAGIEGVADLAGMRVNTGNVGSGTEATAYRVLPYYGIDPATDLALDSKLTLKEQGQALCDGRIDAFLQPTAVGFAVGLETSNTCDVVVVPVDGEPLERLLAEHPYYGRTEITGGTYVGTEEAVETFGYPVVLMASQSVPDEFVYHLVKSVFDNFEDFTRQHPAYGTMTRESSATFGAMAPYHAGAENFYREVGLIE